MKFTVQKMSILTRDLRRTAVNQAINEVQNKKDQVDPLSLESDRARIFESSGNIILIDEDPIAIRIEKKVDFRGLSFTCTNLMPNEEGRFPT